MSDQPHEVIEARGKFLFIGGEKFYVRGTTYGPLTPVEDGEYHNPSVVSKDFSAMAAAGINAVRTYTVPPVWLLDIAQTYNLHVMVGLPWEQHVTFLDDNKLLASIEERVRAGVRRCTGHPALLCYAIGNEIPAPIVRWHGAAKVEKFLKKLYLAVKEEDESALVTYVNYPTTEYLQLPFLDFHCFNVYLEDREILTSYIARLHNLVGEAPLVLAEIGLDSLRNGEDAQAETLDWQVRTAFSAGCAGAFVFAWTDEWHRGGQLVTDWKFGLTDSWRQPKPALERVSQAFTEAPFPISDAWPRISVVVCSHNGAATMRSCCEGLSRLRYPDFEVIVVDDGSTDATADIAAEYGFKVISVENQGLSTARNIGLEAASGEIISYIDDDAYPDPDWLTYIANDFMNNAYAGLGGPNLTPPEDELVAKCVANAPGGPIHVLLSDQEAEHIPGVNMSFRREALQAIGGFDPQFRAAGDDVDICWRLLEANQVIGFSPSAVVWHHRRASALAYYRQQVGYGKAEALLEKKWPERYNALGYPAWHGHLYGGGSFKWRSRRLEKIFHGVWGTAPFQSLYAPGPGGLTSLVLMPEFYLFFILLFAVGMLGFLWSPLFLAIPASLVAIGMSVMAAARNSLLNTTSWTHLAWHEKAERGSLTTLLFAIQPLARLHGRLKYGLVPWRISNVGIRPNITTFFKPLPRSAQIYSKQWRSVVDWMVWLESGLKQRGLAVNRGGEFERWDLYIRLGGLCIIRLLMTVEEYGEGLQLVRYRLQTHMTRLPLAIILCFITLSALTTFAGAWYASILFGMFALIGIVQTRLQKIAAISQITETLAEMEEKSKVKLKPPQKQLDLASNSIEEPQATIQKARYTG